MQLLKHFKDLTVHPKNAQELKGLVLQLAIQGKLTRNWRDKNPNVEPAELLLRRIKKQKEQSFIDNKLKKEKNLSRITRDEIPFTVSKTWVWTRLGDIGTTNVGLTYKPAHINDNGVPVLRSSNVQEGELCLKDLVRVNTDYREKDIIKEGDLLICARNGSRRLVGKCTIIGEIEEVMVFGAFMAIFRSDFNPYLQLFIQSPQYRSKLDGVETTTINQITQGNLKATAVPLPPLEEQKEIVRVVENLFKEVEQLEQLTVERITLKEDFVTSALNQLTTNNAKQEWSYIQNHFKSFFNETSNIKKLRETVLQLAVQGKLTADWRINNTSIESVSNSIQEAFKNKKEIVSGRKKFLNNVEKVIFEDPNLPENWVRSQFFNLCVLKRGHDLPKQDRIKGKYPVASSGGISGWHDEFKTERGVVIGRSGSTGKPHLINDKHWPLNTVLYGEDYCGNHIDFVYIFLKSFDFSQYSSSTAVPTLNRNKFLNELISIPPKEEQKAIVQKVNALMGLCDALEQEVQQSQKHSEQLMQSCLREVFEN